MNSEAPQGLRAPPSLGSEQPARRPGPSTAAASAGNHSRDVPVGEAASEWGAHVRPGSGRASAWGRSLLLPGRSPDIEGRRSEKKKRSLKKDGEEVHTSAPASSAELPELVYITPSQGSRQVVWIASLDKDLPGCTHVRNPRPCSSPGASPHGLAGPWQGLSEDLWGLVAPFGEQVASVCAGAGGMSSRAPAPVSMGQTI